MLLVFRPVNGSSGKRKQFLKVRRELGIQTQACLALGGGCCCGPPWGPDCKPTALNAMPSQTNPEKTQNAVEPFGLIPLCLDDSHVGAGSLDSGFFPKWGKGLWPEGLPASCLGEPPSHLLRGRGQASLLPPSTSFLT